MPYRPPESEKVELESYLSSNLSRMLTAHLGRDVRFDHFEISSPPQTSLNSHLFLIDVGYTETVAQTQGDMRIFLKQPRASGEATGLDRVRDKRRDLLSYETSRLRHSYELGCNTPLVIVRDGGRIFMEFVAGRKLQTLLYDDIDSGVDQVILLDKVMAQLAGTHNRWKQNFALFSDFISSGRRRDYARQFTASFNRCFRVRNGGEDPLSNAEVNAVIGVFNESGLSRVIDGYDENLIHGDLHPGQVIIDEEGNSYFIDLGRFGQGSALLDVSSILFSPFVNLDRRGKLHVAESYKDKRILAKDKEKFSDSLFTMEILWSMIAASHTYSLVHDPRNHQVSEAYREEHRLELSELFRSRGGDVSNNEEDFGSTKLLETFPDWYMWNAFMAVDYVVTNEIGPSETSVLGDILSRYVDDRNPFQDLVDFRLDQTNDSNVGGNGHDSEGPKKKVKLEPSGALV